MILPLRRKCERTQPNYLTEIPMGKVCPSSLGVCSPPEWADWGASGSGHGGLCVFWVFVCFVWGFFCVVLDMEPKPKCLSTSCWVWDPCATAHTSSLPCPSPGSLGCSSSDIWQRLAEVGKQKHGLGNQKHGLAPAIPHAMRGMRNWGRWKLTRPGEDRGEADWAAEGATCG